MKTELFFTEHGIGFPLILLHGNGEDSSYFVHQIRYFSNFYRVIAIDTRGHGKSLKGTMPFTISQFSEDLLHFMDAHQIEKAHLIGFSDGGNIALTFALRHHDRIEKLVLNGANLFPSGMKPMVEMSVYAEYMLAKIRQDRYTMDLMNLMRNEPFIDFQELHRIPNQTLVIIGTQDMIRHSHSLAIAQHLNAEFSVISGDHFIANKQAYLFNHAVHKFLSK